MKLRKRSALDWNKKEKKKKRESVKKKRSRNVSGLSRRELQRKLRKRELG